MDQLDRAERDAEALVSGLTGEEGAWRAEAGGRLASHRGDPEAALQAFLPIPVCEPGGRYRSDKRNHNS